jgi:hypothetical protein
VGLICPPLQWVLGVLSLEVKWLGCEADHSPQSSAKVKECVELLLHSPNTPSWSGAWLSTGATLPLPSPLPDPTFDEWSYDHNHLSLFSL